MIALAPYITMQTLLSAPLGHVLCLSSTTAHQLNCDHTDALRVYARAFLSPVIAGSSIATSNSTDVDFMGSGVFAGVWPKDGDTPLPMKSTSVEFDVAIDDPAMTGDKKARA